MPTVSNHKLMIIRDDILKIRVEFLVSHLRSCKVPVSLPSCLPSVSTRITFLISACFLWIFLISKDMKYKNAACIEVCFLTARSVKVKKLRTFKMITGFVSPGGGMIVACQAST